MFNIYGIDVALNGVGESSFGERVEMYAFISGQYDDPDDDRKLA
jgi:hypothetical protein